MTAPEVISRVRLSSVYQVLTGIPPRRTGRDTWRGPASWRGGDNPDAIALDDSRNCWYDHVTGAGGGVLALVQHACGVSRADALRCVADLAGVALDDRRATRAQARALAQRRRAASSTAQDIEHWRAALIPKLDRDKLRALDAEDDKALERAASLECRLRSGSAADIVREYVRAQHSDPSEVVRLIAAGRQRSSESQRITAQVMLLLTAAGVQRDTA